MRNQIKARCHKASGFLIVFCILMLHTYQCRADPEVEQPACTTEWCDAKWPPKEGSDRTKGKDNCGNVCIKIQKIVETSVEVVDVVEVEVPVEIKETEITVTLKNDENGSPVMTASCPTTFSWYNLRAVAIEKGCVEKLRTKSGETFMVFEDCDK